MTFSTSHLHTRVLERRGEEHVPQVVGEHVERLPLGDARQPGADPAAHGGVNWMESSNESGVL